MKARRNRGIRRLIKALTLDNTLVSMLLIPQRLTFTPSESPIRPSGGLKTDFRITHPRSRITSPLDFCTLRNIDTCS
jgi:hypothetical protein